ncbi:MAG: organoarsenical effux MFS transporter ArsJ [Akkermansiaceae bacterium]|nr:organoarsenical effux MFS transporter ArsJ [Akkermansiaceae bacterium]
MNVKNYVLVTAAYWGFTLTDGALRMLVLLNFHERGLNPIQLAFLFLLYEFCGILTNLFGGWLASTKGLKITLTSGLSLQIISLVLLSLINPDWGLWLAVGYIMGTQALSGVAKDLTKMSSKSAVRVLLPKKDSATQSGLFRWVAILTGSKNALKGVGFLLGGVLLASLGFQWSLWVMAFALGLVLLTSILGLQGDLGRSKQKAKFKELFSKSREINILSFARFFLFASRDIWFVVALPVFLSAQLGWDFTAIGSFMAIWIIGYGIVQASAPAIAKKKGDVGRTAATTLAWGIALTVVTVAIAVGVQFEWNLTKTILGGLILFGIIFAMNSALHSYLILAYSDSDKAALNVGFYYMANAGGRLFGTLLSGLIYQWHGLSGCMWTSSICVLIAASTVVALPRTRDRVNTVS